MTAAETLARLQRLGVVLEATGDKLWYRAPKGALTPELRQATSENKADILALITSTWVPEPDAKELIDQWEDLGRPEISLRPGVSISDLGKWFYPAHGSTTWRPEDLAEVRHFLLEYLPTEEVPQANPVLEEWRRASVPHWEQRLFEAETNGDTRATTYVRWMLVEVLGVDETGAC